MAENNQEQRKVVVSASNRDLNRKWYQKQNQMHNAYSGYYRGMTIAGSVLPALLIYALGVQ